jgi:hypothetical protein
MHATDALLDDHRIPGELVVDNAATELKVEALRSSAGGDENGALGIAKAS